VYVAEDTLPFEGKDDIGNDVEPQAHRRALVHHEHDFEASLPSSAVDQRPRRVAYERLRGCLLVEYLLRRRNSLS
jgi:hypothetical protein